MPMYSMCLAYLNDRIDAEKVVAASGAMLTASGVGLTTGPMLVALAMAELGNAWFFIGLSIMFGLVILAVLRSQATREITPKILKRRRRSCLQVRLVHRSPHSWHRMPKNMRWPWQKTSWKLWTRLSPNWILVTRTKTTQTHSPLDACLAQQSPPAYLHWRSSSRGHVKQICELGPVKLMKSAQSRWPLGARWVASAHAV